MKIETRKVGRLLAMYGAFDPQEVIQLAVEAGKVGADIKHREREDGLGDELYFDKAVSE